MSLSQVWKSGFHAWDRLVERSEPDYVSDRSVGEPSSLLNEVKSLSVETSNRQEETVRHFVEPPPPSVQKSG